jgi:hypothetical protein
LRSGKALVDALFSDPTGSPRAIFIGSLRAPEANNRDRSLPFPALVSYALNHPGLARMCNESGVNHVRERGCGKVISYFARRLDVNSLGSLLNRVRHSQETRHQILVDAIGIRDTEKVRLIAAHPIDTDSRDFWELNTVWQLSERVYASRLKSNAPSPERANGGWHLFELAPPPAPAPPHDSLKLGNICASSTAENAKCVEIRSILAGIKIPKDKLPSLAPPLCPYPTDGSGACNNPERYRAR